MDLLHVLCEKIYSSVPYGDTKIVFKNRKHNKTLSQWFIVPVYFYQITECQFELHYRIKTKSSCHFKLLISLAKVPKRGIKCKFLACYFVNKQIKFLKMYFNKVHNSTQQTIFAFEY